MWQPLKNMLINQVNMSRISIIMTSCMLLMTSCISSSVKEDHITDDIYVTSFDGSSSDYCLSRKLSDDGYVDVLPGKVYAVWNNDSIIVAKQHPSVGYDGEFVDYTNLYIIILDKVGNENGFHNDSVIGPLDVTKLSWKLDELGITDSIVFRNINID